MDVLRDDSVLAGSALSDQRRLLLRICRSSKLLPVGSVRLRNRAAATRSADSPALLRQCDRNRVQSRRSLDRNPFSRYARNGRKSCRNGRCIRMELCGALFFCFPKMKQNSRSFPRSPNQFMSVLAWFWTTGIVAAYTYGFVDIIRLLWTWLMRMGT